MASLILILAIVVLVEVAALLKAAHTADGCDWRCALRQGGPRR